MIDQRVMDALLEWTKGDQEVALRFYNEQHIPSLGRTLAEAVTKHGPETALTYIDMKNHGVYE